MNFLGEGGDEGAEKYKGSNSEDGGEEREKGKGKSRGDKLFSSHERLCEAMTKRERGGEAGGKQG